MINTVSEDFVFIVPNFNASGVLQAWFSSAVPGVGIAINRLAGGTFDSTDFDSTGFNRGYITVAYSS